MLLGGERRRPVSGMYTPGPASDRFERGTQRRRQLRDHDRPRPLHGHGRAGARPSPTAPRNRRPAGRRRPARPRRPGLDRSRLAGFGPTRSRRVRGRRDPVRGRHEPRRQAAPARSGCDPEVADRRGVDHDGRSGACRALDHGLGLAVGLRLRVARHRHRPDGHHALAPTNQGQAHGLDGARGGGGADRRDRCRGSPS